MKRLLILSFVLLISLSDSFAQIGWEAGGWAGVTQYFGDLNSTMAIRRPGFMAGGAARYNFNPRLAFKFSGGYGQVSAYDSDSKNTFEQTRNLSFRSDIIEGTAQLEFNFLPYIHGSKDEFFTPYLYAGFSMINFEPKTKYNGDWIDLRPLGTEGQFKGEEYASTNGAIAFGGGFKVDLSYEWSLNLEFGTRQLFTDYLDDVSTVYPDMEDLENLRGSLAVRLSDRSEPGEFETKIGQPGVQRGNSQNKDSYGYVSIGLLYYFGDLRCPRITR